MGISNKDREIAHPGASCSAGPVRDQDDFVGRYAFVDLDENDETVIYSRKNERAWIQAECSYAIPLVR